MYTRGYILISTSEAQHTCTYAPYTLHTYTLHTYTQSGRLQVEARERAAQEALQNQMDAHRVVNRRRSSVVILPEIESAALQAAAISAELSSSSVEKGKKGKVNKEKAAQGSVVFPSPVKAVVI
jgi:hypothetical protein